jgi:hypothetical protein
MNIINTLEIRRDLREELIWHADEGSHGVCGVRVF